MAVLGKVRYNFKGMWISSTTYAVNDMVQYKQRTYLCISAHSNQTPPNATYWTLMTGTYDDQGQWNSSTSYVVGDIVIANTYMFANTTYPRNFVAGTDSRYQCNTYICIANHSNVSPSNGSYWQTLSIGSSKNTKAMGWLPNRGMVPASGVFPGNSSPGWASTSARPGDSRYDGGKGYATDAHSQYQHPGFISRTGGVVTWGYSYYGSQGFGGNNTIAGLQELSFPFNEWYEGGLLTPDGETPKCIQWISSYAGNIALFNNGEVYCWGYNGHGQMGSGNVTQGNYPIRAGNNYNTTVLRNKKAIRVAHTHLNGGQIAASNYALMSDGTLWSWGYNGYGQLGVGNVTDYSVPQQINVSGLNGTVVDIWASGENYGTLHVLTSTGYMYACGYNGNGELGVGDTTNRSSLTQVSRIWGTGSGKIAKFTFNSRASAGTYYVIDASGQLWTWGYNDYGQMGFDDTSTRSSPTQVTYPYSTGWTNIWVKGGTYCVAFATNSNTNYLYSVGYNGYYNLGRLTGSSPWTHASVGTSGSGYDTYRFQPVYVEKNATAPYYGIITNPVNVWHSGSDTSYCGAIIEEKDGAKYCIGYNGYGWFGFHHSDSYLNRTRECSGGVANYLGKRLRFYPSDLTEAELEIQGINNSSTFAAVWFDKNGKAYASGYNGGWYTANRSNEPGWMAPISSIAES